MLHLGIYLHFPRYFYTFSSTKKIVDTCDDGNDFITVLIAIESKIHKRLLYIHHTRFDIDYNTTLIKYNMIILAGFQLQKKFEETSEF